MQNAKLPVVAIIGRPNVGKSTLFNRIAGQRRAIVHDQPGVTRDRLRLEVSWNETPFILVDTGGYEPGHEDECVRMVTTQARQALRDSDAVIFLTDAAAGLSPVDAEVADTLRKGGKRVFLAVNKVDHPRHEALSADFASLGFATLHTLSAEHGIGVSELMDEVVSSLPGIEAVEADQEEVPGIAVVGRPNVGKSTLVNHFLGEERVITDHRPGTTRDAIDSLLHRGRKKYLLIDTAGIRRRGKIRQAVEKFSVHRSREAIYRSDICLLLLDAREMLTDQDMKIAGMIKDAGRGCIILVNKWDLAEGLDREAARKSIRDEMPFVNYAPIMFISALEGRGTKKIFLKVEAIYRELHRTVPTPKLNRFLGSAVRTFKPGSSKGRPVTFAYMSQSKVNPPTFTILTNDPARVHFTYRRYLLNRLRKEFNFTGVPLVVRFRQKKSRARKR